MAVLIFLQELKCQCWRSLCLVKFSFLLLEDLVLSHSNSKAKPIALMMPGLILKTVKLTKMLALIPGLWNVSGQLNMEVFISLVVTNLKKYIYSFLVKNNSKSWLVTFDFLQSHSENFSMMFSSATMASILRLLSCGDKSVELFSMRSKQGFLYSSTHHQLKLYTPNWRKLLLKSTVSCDDTYSMEIQYYSLFVLLRQIRIRSIQMRGQWPKMFLRVILSL